MLRLRHSGKHCSSIGSKIPTTVLMADQTAVTMEYSSQGPEGLEPLELSVTPLSSDISLPPPFTSERMLAQRDRPTSSPALTWPIPSSTDPSETSFDRLLPVYIPIGTIFVVVLLAMIWLLMVPSARRPWFCRSHRGENQIPLRQRGPGDAYEVNPEMWRGGGRFIGESVDSRTGNAGSNETRSSGQGQRAEVNVQGMAAGMAGAEEHQTNRYMPPNGRGATSAASMQSRRDEDVPPPYQAKAEQDFGPGVQN